MSSEPYADDRQSLYALSWRYAQDGKLAIDIATGIVVDANPAAERLMSYTREELIGMHTAMLHPEAEREKVQNVLRRDVPRPLLHKDFHLQRKDSLSVPVAIWSSGALDFADRSLVIVEFRDISEEKRKEHLLAAQNWAMSAFSIAALALGRARSPEDLLQSICEAITRESVYLLAWIGIAEDDPGKTLRLAASAGSALGYLDGVHVSWSEDLPAGLGPTGVCVRTNTMYIIDDSETAPIFVPWRKRAKKFGIRSSISIPLHVEGSWNGALVVYSAHPHAFEAAPIEVFERLGEQIVHGIHALEQKHLLEAARLHREMVQKHLTEALSASVSAMVTAMEMRDPYTAGHESRVADIAYVIGREMGWPEERLQSLRMAAMVHDIGKISIPVEILTKPGRLTADEFELVKGHSESGYAILKDIPFNAPIADIVRQHHEKLDGSGYPLGLKADAILPESRILAVADMVEAMSSDRPYRRGMDIDVVLECIENQAGTLLDAEVVRICAELFRAKRLFPNSLNLR